MPLGVMPLNMHGSTIEAAPRKGKSSERKEKKTAKADEKATLKEAAAAQEVATRAGKAAKKASLAKAKANEEAAGKKIDAEKESSRCKVLAEKRAQMDKEEAAVFTRTSAAHVASKKAQVAAKEEAALNEANAEEKAATEKEEAAVFAAAKAAASLERIKRKPLRTPRKSRASRYLRKHCRTLCNVWTAATRPFAHRPSWDKNCRLCVEKRGLDSESEIERMKPVDTGVVDLLFGSQYAYFAREERRSRMPLD